MVPFLVPGLKTLTHVDEPEVYEDALAASTSSSIPVFCMNGPPATGMIYYKYWLKGSLLYSY
jgi:hypothetical protein